MTSSPRSIDYAEFSDDPSYQNKVTQGQYEGGDHYEDLRDSLDSASYHSLLHQEIFFQEHPQHEKFEEYIYDDEMAVSGAAFLSNAFFYSPHNSFSESVATSVDRVSRNNAKASVFIMFSALAASLMSLDIKVFNNWTSGDGMFVAMCTCGTGLIVSVFYLLRYHKGPFLRDPLKLKWLLLRSVLGGLSALCAFAAVARLDLAVANVLMFTMPLWTAMLSYVVLGRSWDFKDLLMAVSCLTGVILVSELWDVTTLSTLDDDDADDRLTETSLQSSITGLSAALGFAITNAIAAVIVNTKLKGESPMLMTAMSMFVGLTIASCFFMMIHYQRARTKQDFFLKSHPWYVWACLIYLGIAMITQQACRNKGLALASDSSVTVVLYFEVVFSFTWDVVVLGTSPDSIQWIGAGIIVIGSVLSAGLKSQAIKKQIRKHLLQIEQESLHKNSNEQFLTHDDHLSSAFHNSYDENVSVASDVSDSFHGRKLLVNEFSNDQDDDDYEQVYTMPTNV